MNKKDVKNDAAKRLTNKKFRCGNAFEIDWKSVEVRNIRLQKHESFKKGAWTKTTVFMQ